MLAGYLVFWRPTILSRYPCLLTAVAGLLWLTIFQKLSHPEDHCTGMHKRYTFCTNQWTQGRNSVHSRVVAFHVYVLQQKVLYNVPVVHK